MNAPSAIGNATASNVSPGSGSTQLYGRRLTLARALWIVITLMTIALFLASLPPYADYIKTICTTTSCSWQQLTQGRVVALQALGFTIDDYAAFMMAFNLIFGGVYLAVALLIFVRRSDHGLALFSSLMLVTFGLGTFANLFERLVSLYPLLWLPARTIQYIGDISLIIFFYIFPDGRFVPRWSRAISVLWVIVRAFETYFPDSPLAQSRWPDLLNSAFFIGVITSGLLAQVYRYRRVSQARERQQTKWVVFGVTVGVGTFIGVILLFGVIPSLDQNIILYLVGNIILLLSILVIPISIGIAILHSHLWGIDSIINRAIVYGTLTAILAGVYSASITLLQKIFIAVTGDKSDAAVVLTTLILASTFTPIKNTLQALADKKVKEAPDPTRKLRAFGEQVRSVIQVIRVEQVTRRTLEEATVAFGARGGAVHLQQDGQLRLIHAHGEWNGDARLSVPLELDGEQLGVIALGPRRNHEEYTERDRDLLKQIGDLVALAIEHARR